MEVNAIMTTTLDTVQPDQVIGDLYELFDKVNYHHIPVVKDSILVGVISDRDVLRNISPFLNTKQQRPQDIQLMQQTVEKIMSTDLICVDNSSSIECASILLLENNISCLPVVDEDMKLEGLLTWKDILSYQVYNDA